MHIGMPGQPVIISLVRSVVIQNDVHLLRVGNILNDIIHKCLEVRSLLDRSDLRLNHPGGHVQRNKEIDRAVAFVCAFDATHDLAAAGLDVARFSLQCLYRWLPSTLSTMALLGAPRYKPITSSALAANSGSVLTHHERIRCS